MNRGVLQSSPVQQMMAAGNPNWWNINNLMRPPPLVPSSSISSSVSSSSHHHHHHQNPSLHHNDVLQAQYNMNSSSSSWINDDNHTQYQQLPPESWSQLIFGGVLIGEEAKKMGSWEEQVMLHHLQSALIDQVKPESSVDSYNNNHESHHHHQQLIPPKTWSHHQHNYPHMNIIPVSSPQSSVTTYSSNNNNNNNNNNSMLDFSSPKSSSDNNLHARHLDRSSECNSTATGGALKKAKVQPSSSQSTFKVRKEKLGDRITALHQLVSPFGKTDTASVLLEAIGYIRFLQSQIQALSLPYLNSGAGNKMQPHNVQGERNCIFPEDPGQLLNENCLKRKCGPNQESYEEAKDLRSRGLCLVPVSCTLHVGSDNGADYWAPALGGSFR